MICDIMFAIYVKSLSNHACNIPKNLSEISSKESVYISTVSNKINKSITSITVIPLSDLCNFARFPKRNSNNNSSGQWIFNRQQR
jgi:hypothetical protein